MKVLRLTHDEGEGKGTCCIYDAEKPDALLEEIKEMQYCEAGERWIITVEDMDKGDFEELVEFTGW